uniref:NADH dehydrogenase subunit 5 n=1 Tax=Brugia timori TaxID=42155 RepID=A0A0R3QYQ8_9BILA
LISFINRISNKPFLIKGTIYYNIYWSKFNIFSSTFFRISWNTSTIFRFS